MRNFPSLLKPVLIASIAASALAFAVGSASAAPARNVLIAVDGPAVTYKVVHKGSIIRLLYHTDSLNGIDVKVSSKHHVLRHFAGKPVTVHSKTLVPLAQDYKAVKPGRAVIIADESRPSLGGVHSHFRHKIYVSVTR